MMVTHDIRMARTHSAQSVSSSTLCQRRGSVMAATKRHSLLCAPTTSTMRRSNSAQQQQQHTLFPVHAPSASSIPLSRSNSSTSSSSSSKRSSSRRSNARSALVAPSSTTSSNCASSQGEPGAHPPSHFSDTSSPIPAQPSPPLLSRSERLKRSLAPSQDAFDDEYQEDILAHMFQLEDSHRPALETLDTQPEISWSTMRAPLIDFLLEMSASFHFQPETLFVSVNLLDRYMSKRVVLRKHYQLAGASAMWIAAKYEDFKDAVPTANELATMCYNTLDESAFQQMEAHILSTLHYALGSPTHETWLRTYVGQSSSGPLALAVPPEVVGIARFLLELSLYHRDFVPLLPSALVRASLWLAQLVFSAPGPMGLMMNQATRVLDPQASQAALALYRLLNQGHHSDILVRKHHHAYALVQTALRRTVHYTAALSPTKHVTLCTPPRAITTPLGRTNDLSLSPATPSLWLTPRTMSATLSGDEDDDGPLTPCTVLSPLPSEAGTVDQGEVDLDVVGLGICGSTSSDGSSSNSGNRLGLTIEGEEKKQVSIVPRAGPQIVVNHGI